MNGKTTEHPNIALLADYLDGRLSAKNAMQVRTHLGECPLCRLEVKRIKRFEKIDSDTGLMEEARWDSVRFDLERAFREKVLPVVVEREGRDTRALRPSRRFWWLAPLAAAAAVLLIFVHIERNVLQFEPSRGPGPMRGGTTEYEITLLETSGELDEAPSVFTWRSIREDDYYTLEVFTPDLSRIFVADTINGTRWAAADSLKALLEPGMIYLWSVTGHMGLERKIVSPNGWFRIAAERE